MESRKLKNKQGEILKTKEGDELVEHRFEPGDEFIPHYNSVLERKNEVVIKGQDKTITNYSIKCSVKTKEGQKHDEVFVALTPTQAKSLNKKKDEGVELNQNKFIVYNYEHKEHGTCIGIGMKSDRKPPKTFEDFDEN